MFLKINKAQGPIASDLGLLNLTDGWIALDTEGTGLDAWGTKGIDRAAEPARTFAVSFCDADGNFGFERWRVDPKTRKVHATPSKELRKLLADKTVKKVLYNANFDVRFLEKAGLEVSGPIIDVLLMVHVLDPDSFDKRLKPTAKKIVNIPMDDEEDLKQSIKKVRARTRAARLRVKSGIATAEDLEFSLYAIHEPEGNEWQELKTSDDSSTMADCFLGDHAALRKYACVDALRTAMLYLACVDALDRDKADGGKLWEIYNMEQELQVVVKSMEDRGIRVDPARNEEVIAFYLKLIAKHGKAVRAIAGEDFNAKSWRFKQRYFFKDRDFVPIRYSENKSKTTQRTKKYPACQWCKGIGCKVCQGTGRSPKCDGEFLESVGVDKTGDEPKKKEPLAWELLHYTAASSMLSFCAAFQRFGCVEKDGTILHPNFKQAGPVTGRFSSENPNLQNIADDDSGKKRVAIPYRSREPIIPRAEHVLYLPDYSQIEIWILFLRSKDKALGEILLAGGDTHGRVAQTVVPGAFDLEQALKDKNKDPNALTPGKLANLKAYVTTRKKAKNTQFCKVYGGGPKKIAQVAGCSLIDAEEFVERYEATFSGVTEFMQSNLLFVRKNGYITNAYGRVYPIDRDRAYVGTNYDIQGTAADLIKRAMIRVYKNVCQTAYKGKVFLELTMHDELCLDVHKSVDNKTTMRAIVTEMQADYKLLGCPIPFPVGMKISTARWSETMEVKL